MERPAFPFVLNRLKSERLEGGTLISPESTRQPLEEESESLILKRIYGVYQTEQSGLCCLSRSFFLLFSPSHSRLLLKLNINLIYQLAWTVSSLIAFEKFHRAARASMCSSSDESSGRVIHTAISRWLSLCRSQLEVLGLSVRIIQRVVRESVRFQWNEI